MLDFYDVFTSHTMLVYFLGLLWTAPELLSLTVKNKSKLGDVYAYGIILSEIITRTLPYENYGYPPKGIWKCFHQLYHQVVL